jgi:hypothetical protein
MSVIAQDKVLHTRTAISRAALEEEITKAVKTDDTCAEFAGVIVQRARDQKDREANWSIKGIKFGRADRDKAAPVIAVVVERMQRLYGLMDDQHD